MRIKFLGGCVAAAPIIQSLAFTSNKIALSSFVLFSSSSTIPTRLSSIQKQQQQGSSSSLLLSSSGSFTASSSSTTSLFASARMMGTGPYRNDDETIFKALTQSKTIALIGASHKPNRPAYYVMEYLLQKGYNVIPVNPGLDGQTLLGQTVYKSLSSIPLNLQQQIDMIDIFRNSASVEPIIDEVISIQQQQQQQRSSSSLLVDDEGSNNNNESQIIKTIWMQVGVINEVAAQKAKDAGMDVIMNACPKIEIPRLGITGPSEQPIISEL